MLLRFLLFVNFKKLNALYFLLDTEEKASFTYFKQKEKNH